MQYPFGFKELVRLPPSLAFHPRRLARSGPVPQSSRTLLSAIPQSMPLPWCLGEHGASPVSKLDAAS